MKNSVHAHLCAPFTFQIGKKWCLFWWAWTGCDMQCKVFILKKRYGMQQLSLQFQSGHPVHLARCNFYKPLFASTSNCYYLLPKQNVFLWMWQWNYKTYIPHCLLYSCTVYLSQCVNQESQHTAAESQSNHTEVALHNLKKTLICQH